MKNLPLDPVELIRLIADDLEKTLVQYYVSVNLRAWVSYGGEFPGKNGEICFVSLGGAVMLNTLGISCYTTLSKDSINMTLIDAVGTLERFDFKMFFHLVHKAHRLKNGYGVKAPVSKKLISQLKDKYDPEQGWSGSVEDAEIPTLVAQLRDIADMTEEDVIKQKKRLPLDPVDLIRLAADDLEKTITQDKIVIDLGFLMSGSHIEGKCTVGLAGAVMLNTLNTVEYPNTHADPTRFGIDEYILQHQLAALNHLCDFEFCNFFTMIKAANELAGKKYKKPGLTLKGFLWTKYQAGTEKYGRVSNEEIPELAAQLREIARTIELEMIRKK